MGLTARTMRSQFPYKEVSANMVLAMSGDGRVSTVDEDNDVFETPFARTIFKEKYSRDGRERWADTANRVVDNVCGDLVGPDIKNALKDLIVQRKFIPGGRYLFAAGRDYHQVNNCFLFRADDSREGWANALSQSMTALMSGGGIGFDYSPVREYGAVVKRTGGIATGPLSLAMAVNEAGRQVLNGGNRRSAIWGGLRWNHPDIDRWMSCKNWSEELRAMKAKDPKFPLPMEFTNISNVYDRSFFDAYNAGDEKARSVWRKNCRQSFETAEPGFSFNFKNAMESLRNACTEVTSEDSDDKCNLGTLWMAKFATLEEFREAVKLAVIFLLCGGIYSHVPTDAIRDVGSKNNRIGLGIGGMHEWLMMRHADYEVTPEMHRWLEVYRDESDAAAYTWSAILGVNFPKGRRAIAPNGTIGIVAESTTGIEPLFCAAYMRRYYMPEGWRFQYVVDGAVKRLLSRGVPLAVIEANDAYALRFEDRLRFQADVQDYVDMAISSTCNMASWGTEENNESNVDEKADILYKYAHRLRGFTTYPDGCRGGQPLTKVSVKKALDREGTIFLEEIRECTNGVCGL